MKKRPITLPLIRQNGAAWERLVVGTAKAPQYEAYAWDEAAWEARQDRAEQRRTEAMLNTIQTGDARELAKAIPDASVDLIFTDPVYDRMDDYRWLAETAARVLKPDRACLAFSSIGQLPATLQAMADVGLTFRWQFIEYRTNEVKHRHAPGGKCVYVPLLWLDKGKRRPSFVLDVRAVAVHTTSSNHEWSKPPLTIRYYLEAFTKPGDVVFDPFVGGGTTAAVAKEAGRSFIAFEIDPVRAERAQRRVAQTQEMHPVLLDRQESMELAS